MKRDGAAQTVAHFYDHIDYAQKLERRAGYCNETTSYLTTVPEDTIRILVIIETNPALKAFQNQLFNGGKGLYIYSEGTKITRKKTERGIEDDSIRKLYYIPDSSKKNHASRGSITLTTFCSFHKDFSNQQLSKVCETEMIPKYDLVIVDEASQVGVRSFVTILVHTSRNDTVHRLPMFIICGAHFQN